MTERKLGPDDIMHEVDEVKRETGHGQVTILITDGNIVEITKMVKRRQPRTLSLEQGKSLFEGGKK